MKSLLDLGSNSQTDDSDCSMIHWKRKPRVGFAYNIQHGPPMLSSPNIKQSCKIHIWEEVDTRETALSHRYRHWGYSYQRSFT